MFSLDFDLNELSQLNLSVMTRKDFIKSLMVSLPEKSKLYKMYEKDLLVLETLQNKFLL